MKKFNKYISILMIFIGIFSASQVSATHIVGGEITYKSLGNNDYEIILTLRRDCNPGNLQFDPTASIGIFDGTTGTFVNELVLPFMASDSVGNTIVAECGFIGSNVCVQITSYRVVVNLTPQAGGYIFAYQRCCRNETLLNVVDPLYVGSTQWVHLTEEAMLLGNSTPTFNAWPDVYICANTPLVFNHSAIDADGDSLVYKTCVPYDGATFANPNPEPPAGPPYNSIPLLSPYDLSNMMGGTPLVIDAQTGIITANPNQIGQFSIGICVEEYRNGKLISTTHRDFQYNVRICLDPVQASFTRNEDPCNEELTYEFKNTTQDGATYNWNFNYPSTNPSFNSTAENPTFTYTEPGTYIVQLTGTTITRQCVDVVYDTIVIDARPANLTLSGPSNICTPNQKYTVGGGYGNYEWSNTPDFANILATGPEADIFFMDAVTTIYVRSTKSAECPPRVVSINVTNRAFEVNYESSQTLCKGKEKTISFSHNSNSLVTFVWNDPRVVASTDNSVTINSLPSDSGEITITGVATNEFGCTQDIILKVTISSAASPMFTATLKSCDDLTMCFNVTPAVSNIAWDFGVTGNSDTSSTASPCFLYPQAGNYIVRLTSKDPVCPFDAVTNTIVVPDINSNATITATIKDCNMKEVCFTATGNILGNIVWNFGDPSSSDNTSTMVNPCHKYTTEGTYNVTLTNSNTICPFDEVKTTVVIKAPLKISALGPLTVCSGASTDLMAQSNDPTAKYEWCANGVKIGDGPLLTVSPTANSTYVLKASNAEGCTDSIDVVVNVFNFDYTNDVPTIICPGDEYQIKVNIANPNDYTFVWTPADIIVNGGNTNAPLIMAMAGKEIKVVITSKITGCSSTATFNPTVQSAPAFTITSNLCPNQNGTINLSIQNPDNYTYVWTPASAIVSGGDTRNPVIKLGATTDLKVIITNITTGCMTDGSHTATVPAPIVVSFTNPQVEITQGKDGVLEIKNPIAGAVYTWSTGQTGTSITVDPTVNTTYTVSVTDPNGCTGSGTINVVVRTVNCTEKEEYLPNAFTPNEDNINDILYVKSNVITDMELVIYNRWGQEVFSSTDINKGWDGSCDGKKLSPDAYAYYLKGTCLNGDTFIKKGNVSILK